MPKVFDWQGFRFHFYSDEGEPREPLHIHVVKNSADAKFWLYPDIELAYNRGFNARTIKQLRDIVDERRHEIERAWDEHFR